MKKDSGPYKKIKIYCYIVGLTAFLTAFFVGIFLLHNLEKNEKTTGKYMAQVTEKRVRARLDQYIMLSNLLGNYISAGENLDENTFSELAEKIPNEDGVIKAFELAPDGIVTDIYPKQENEGAFGLDMLQEHERKKDAVVARENGKYTIGGPYQLKQGGTGALLFNPIYQDNNSDKGEFWGFVILVIDWNRFIDEINLNYLSDVDFCYRIWSYDRDGNDRIILAESQDDMPDNILTVECTVPNNTWYFDIIPSEGWIPRSYWIMCIVSSYVFSLLIATVFYLISSKKHRERQYEAELEKAAEQAKNANEAKTRFLFNMSHDIRTPMNAIVGLTKLMQYSLNDPETLDSYIQKLQSSSEYLLGLINDILDLSKIESGSIELKKESMNLRKVAEQIAAIIRPNVLSGGKKFRISEESFCHEHVLGDSIRIRQVLMNLLSNAVKYTPEGGEISLRVEELSSDKKYAKYRFTVEDTGIGMTEEFLQHIFEPFARAEMLEREIQGTGLGMAITKSIVDSMRGTIEVYSTIGKGSRERSGRQYGRNKRFDPQWHAFSLCGR